MSDVMQPVENPTAYVKLDVDLPTQWEVVSNAAWEQLDRPDVSGSPFIHAMRNAMTRVGRPDLLAAVFAPIAGHDDVITNVVMCSLAIECFVLSEMPDLAWPPTGEVQSVEFSPGEFADIYRLTIAVRDEAAGIGAVSTFATPNLTLAPAMAPGFRTVADSIRFVAVDEPA